MSKLLIDGDGIIYRAGFATEKTKYLVTPKHGSEICECLKHDDSKAAQEDAETRGGLIWSRKDVKPEEEALMLASIILKDIRERYSDLVPVVYLSPSVGNFRDAIATRAKYKGNRDAQARPVHYKALRTYLTERYNAIEAVGQEADDELGIGMTEYPGSVCVSFDKDLLQIPGRHYNWVTKEEFTISKKDGALNFWAQVLAGDPVDNVPGIEKIGPAKARKILEGVRSSAEAENVVLMAYLDKYGNTLGPKYMEETKALVWVRRERVK